MLNFEYFSSRLHQSGSSPRARLRGLTLLLMQWNRERVAGQATATRLDLTQKEVEILQELIYGETSKLNVKQADVLSEQILFLILGALRRDPQHESAHMWQMVDQGIDAFIKPEPSLFSNFNFVSLMAIMVLLLWATSHVLLSKPNSTKLYPEEISQSEERRSKINRLVMLHEEMRQGYCQIPQAAMLDPKQRASFIRFINQGQISIESAEDLKQALTFVSCSYPQKLMDNPLNH